MILGLFKSVRGGGGQGGCCSPSLVRNINYSGNFYLRVGQSSCSCFCFTNILNIFFLFVTCSMHKNPHQNAGNGIKETLFFKIFLGSMARTPLEVLAPSARVGQIRVRPPKISKPVRLWVYLPNSKVIIAFRLHLEANA